MNASALYAARRKELLMRRGVVLPAIALLAALVLATPAGAITYGTPDGDGHPEVGALLAPQAYADGTWAACSGTLISPTVFLTAAHCPSGFQAAMSGMSSPSCPAPAGLAKQAGSTQTKQCEANGQQRHRACRPGERQLTSGSAARGRGG